MLPVIVLESEFGSPKTIALSSVPLDLTRDCIDMLFVK
jgi:hypothetical protein